MNCFEPTDSDLEKVKEYAKSLTPIEEIAVLMHVDEDTLRECIAKKDHPLRWAYLTGKVDTALAIRKSEINMAINGSPIAVQHADSYLAAMTSNEIE